MNELTSIQCTNAINQAMHNATEGAYITMVSHGNGYFQFEWDKVRDLQHG